MPAERESELGDEGDMRDDSEVYRCLSPVLLVLLGPVVLGVLGALSAVEGDAGPAVGAGAAGGVGVGDADKAEVYVCLSSGLAVLVPVAEGMSVDGY